jgi:hypothetical protein
MLDPRQNIGFEPGRISKESWPSTIFAPSLTFHFFLSISLSLNSSDQTSLREVSGPASRAQVQNRKDSRREGGTA